MPSVQIAIDCARPHHLADFYAAALGYRSDVDEEQIRSLLAAGACTEDDVTTHRGTLVWKDGAAVTDPEGVRPRIYFQKVAEGKTTKNRVHIDVQTGLDDIGPEVARIEALGATRLWDGQQGPHAWVTMADPEGNEFCVS